MSNIEEFKSNGSQLITQEERTEYHAKMQAAKTAEEQEQIRKENHERLKEQAKTRRGVILPKAPPARGGRGMGSGSGGMGHGGGRNR
ncbi:hypothetical protein THII_3244 [Thioploca ingrica]|uniref:Uncharacterized protein n=1 Tax=Thioploca ingrica TaxID=40754 RepID=A0A090BVW0_9GAMM|nr:hypothetical protein THII_3244 [Thioploca ingrica]